MPAPPPPPGFKLDTLGAIPPPPAGYKLDTPALLQPQTKGPEPSTTAPGLAASLARGAAPYAAGAGIGMAVGGPPGALAGISATALTELVTGVYDALGHPLGRAAGPQDVTDKILDAIGIRRPQTGMERTAEMAGGLAGSMMGIPVTPKPLGAPNDAQKLLQDFERQKVTPSVPVVGQGRTAGLASQIGNILPITGPVIRGAVTKNLGETAAAAERAAAQFGQGGDTFDAGSIVRNALQRFAADKSQATLDYGHFFRMMAGAPPAAMTNTLKLVKDLMGRFPNAPSLSGMFTRSPIARLAEELEPRTVQIPAKMSTVLNAAGQPTVLRAAQTVQRGGVLSIPELQELRSQVGYQLEHPSFGPEDIPRGQLKRLYAALTTDMRNAARNKGPAALKALQHATANYAIRMKLIDRLAPLVSGQGAERVFTKLNTAALTSGTGSDAGLLRAAKQVMSPQEWGDFGASVISRLGKPAPGAKDILSGADFSPSSFMTNWNKLSDRAKNMVFGPDVTGSPRANLESLARVAQAQKNVGKLANVSRSGEFTVTGILGLRAAEAAWQAIMTGQVGEFAGWGAASGAGYGFAKMLMSPQFARWLYQLPKTAIITPQTVAQATANLLAALMTPETRTPREQPQGRSPAPTNPTTAGMQP